VGGDLLWFNRMRFRLLDRVKHALHVFPLVTIHIRFTQHCRRSMLRQAAIQPCQSTPSRCPLDVQVVQLKPRWRRIIPVIRNQRRHTLTPTAHRSAHALPLRRRYSQRQIRTRRDRRHTYTIISTTPPFPAKARPTNPNKNPRMPNLRRILIPTHRTPINHPLRRPLGLIRIIVQRSGIRHRP
jgi:hypothetical protein